MKYLKYIYAVVAVVSLLLFTVATVSASISQTAKKSHARISNKKHTPVMKKTHSLKKGKSREGRHTAIKGNSHRPRVYVAKKGDTIANVARRFGKKAVELRKINGLKGNVLRPGQKVLLAGMPTEKARIFRVYALRQAMEANTARLAEVRLTTSEDLLAGLSIEERLIVFAKKMLRFPYYFGGEGARGLDCSGYVQKVFNFVGQNIPRSAREQFNLGEAIERDDLKAGDLVFFRTYANFPSHVGIYLGNNLFIHASSSSRKVTINSLETPYYVRRYIGAKRVIAEDEIAVN